MAPRYSRQTPEQRRSALFSAAFDPEDEGAEGNQALLEQADRMSFDAHADPATQAFADGGEVNAAGDAANEDRAVLKESRIQQMNRDARERSLQADADRINANSRDMDQRRELTSRGYTKTSDSSVSPDPSAQNRRRIIAGMSAIRSQPRPVHQGPLDGDNRREADMGALRRNLMDAGAKVYRGSSLATRYAEGGSVIDPDSFLAKRTALLDRAAAGKDGKEAASSAARVRRQAQIANEMASTGQPKREAKIPSGGTLPVYTGEGDKPRIDISQKKDDTREVNRYAKGGYVDRLMSKGKLNSQMLRSLRGK